MRSGQSIPRALIEDEGRKVVGGASPSRPPPSYNQFAFFGSGGRAGSGAQGTPSSFSFLISAGVASP